MPTYALGMFIALLLSTTLQAAELLKFNDQAINSIGERVIELKIREAGYGVVHLILPESAVSMKDWESSGVVKASWLKCRSREMEKGSGELNQCIRRAFLAIGGEGDRLVPGELVLSKLKGIGFKLSISLVGRKRIELIVSERLPKIVRSGPFRQLDFANEGTPKASTPDRYGDGDEKVGFVFLGDSGTGKKEQYEVAKGVAKFCRSHLCEFAALLGDNIYSEGVSNIYDPQFDEKFELPYQGVDLIFRPALGNHDHGGNIHAQISYSEISEKWDMPARYYAYSYDHVAFFVIDSDDADVTQLRWLEAELKASKARWKIVYGHHPVYSYGQHGHTELLVDYLLPVLKRHKVDFYLSGHDHDKQVMHSDGMTFIVSGAAAKTRGVRAGKRTVYAESKLGFAHFLIDGDSAHLKILDSKGRPDYERTYNKTAYVQHK